MEELDLVSFADVPDEEKVKILLQSNKALRGKLKAEEMEVRSLIDELDRAKTKISNLVNQQSRIDSLQSKLTHFQRLFEMKPKKVILKIPGQVIAYLNHIGKYNEFVSWYSNQHNKYGKNGSTN